MQEKLTKEDWRATNKQKLLINQKIEHFSKKEASYLINIIDAIYNTRPSNKNKTNNTT